MELLQTFHYCDSEGKSDEDLQLIALDYAGKKVDLKNYSSYKIEQKFESRFGNTKVYQFVVYGEKMSNEETKKEAKGLKYDQGKWSITLMPNEGITEIAKAFDHGANKYSAQNYRNGLHWSRLIDATIRHMLAFKEGEDLDIESGHNHVAHAGASIMMLLYNIANKPELDDRWKNPKNQKK